MEKNRESLSPKKGLKSTKITGWIARDIPSSDSDFELLVRQGIFFPFGKKAIIFNEVDSRFLFPDIRTNKYGLVVEDFFEAKCFSG
jgi:hypothetical protein